MGEKPLLTRRRIAGAAAIILAAVFMLSGTYAWRDYRQHKTNEANSDGIVYKARLVEEFDPDDVKDWKITDPKVTKTVSVLNPGAETADDTANYGDIFVRLQLKEFMEFYEVTYIRTAERYMTDKDGQFIAFDPADYGSPAAAFAAAQAYAADLEAKYGNAPHIIKQERMYNTPAAVANANLPWYIQTKESDPGGIYGDFIITGIEVDESGPRNIIKDASQIPGKASGDQAANHNDYTFHEGEPDSAAAHGNGECNYTVHTWNGGLYSFFVNGPGEETFMDYIEWIFGGDVITYEQWQNNFGGKVVEKWVVDTNSPEGWVYWMSPLAPGQKTSDLLKAMDLIKQPGDAFYYALHVDMQAVCFNELDNWITDIPPGNAAPADIINTLKAGYEKITSIVITPDSANAAQNATQQFTAAVRGTSGISQEVIWSVDGAKEAGTTISEGGLLTVDAAEEAGTVLTVTAVSKADNAVAGTAYVTITETP